MGFLKPSSMATRRARHDRALMDKILALLPADDLEVHLDVAMALMARVVKKTEECAREAEMKNLERVENAHKEKQQKLETRFRNICEVNGRLSDENERLRTELAKLDAIRTSVKNIGRGPSRAVEVEPVTSQALHRSQIYAHTGEMTAPASAAWGTSAAHESSAENLVAAIDSRLSGNVTAPLSPSRPSIAATKARVSAGASGGSSVVDGKEFFRECRMRLDSGAFEEFISEIRNLNIQSVSRDDVFTKAKGIFGNNNYDLLRKLHLLLYSAEMKTRHG